ncbi:MAG: hypothetical protein R3C14_07440 [Caldilineaceae bacterium]
MSTAMVVTTVITADADVEKVKTFTLEQIRDNDRGLLDNLLNQGVDACVITAILNVDEFLDYIRIRRRQGTAQAQEQAEATAEPSPTVVITDGMSESEFMEYTLQQLNKGERTPLVPLSEETLEAIEEEHIGQHFSCYPFLY